MCAGEFSGDIDTDDLRNQFKRPSMQEKFDKELREIDKRLEQKEVKRLAFREGYFERIVHDRKNYLFFHLIVGPLYKNCLLWFSIVLKG